MARLTVGEATPLVMTKCVMLSALLQQLGEPDRLEVFRDRLQDERRIQTANRVHLPFRRWLPVAAAVPVLVGALFFSNRYTSVLRAEELLTKAGKLNFQRTAHSR